MNQKIVFGKGKGPAEILRNEKAMSDNLGEAKSGYERHHLIPLSIAIKHPLVLEAMARGKPPYDPNSGLIYLPKDEITAKSEPGLPIHKGSHRKWSTNVERMLDLLRIGMRIHYGEIPPEAQSRALYKTQEKLRQQIKKLRVVD